MVAAAAAVVGTAVVGIAAVFCGDVECGLLPPMSLVA
jgi:hypothetical protein